MDLSHQHVYGVIAPQCSTDLKGAKRWCSSGSLIEGGLCWQSLGREWNHSAGCGNMDLELTLPGFWHCAFSYAVKSSTLAEKCFTQVTGIIRVIWISSVLWLKLWGTQNAFSIISILLAAKRINRITQLRPLHSHVWDKACQVKLFPSPCCYEFIVQCLLSPSLKKTKTKTKHMFSINKNVKARELGRGI